MIALILTLVFWGLIFYVLWWGLGKIGLPEPFNKVITVVLIIGCVLVLIGILNGNLHPFPIFRGIV